MKEIKLHLNLEAARKQGIVFASDVIERADEIINQERRNVYTIE
jgi:ABC-type uncharacterized transport system substrate-binding protein